MSSRRPRPYRLWFEQLETRLAPAVMFANSANWAGYAVVGARASISYISASWTVPAVTGPANGYSATWVGIDGARSNTVEQIGTEADYVNGETSYYAWYQMYPAPTFVINRPVQPGQQIVASVAFASGQGFTLSINSPSWDSAFTTTIKAPAARSSAEAVVEAPSFHGVLPLANYTTESFSSVDVTVGKTTSSIGTAAKGKVEQIDMVSRGGRASETASPLNSAGNSFTVNFHAGQNQSGSGQGGNNSGHTSHDINQTIIIVTITVPQINNNLPFVVTPTQRPPITVFTQLPPTAVPATTVAPPPVLIDPFVGSGISDALPAAHDNGPDRGGAVAPAGPVQVPPINAPMAPNVPPQQSRLDDGLPPAGVSYFATDAETAMLQDESPAANEFADTAERTVEVAGVVLMLGLGTSCGASLGDREARKKPIAL